MSDFNPVADEPEFEPLAVICHECGNDDAAVGYIFCLDCLELLTETRYPKFLGSR